MRELDLIMGRFADGEVANLGEEDLGAFEELMEAPDRDMFAWLTGACQVPPNYDTAVFRRLKAFHTHRQPLHI